MYSISGFGEMIADSVRMSAYVRALRQAINPSSVVLDIGSGTGVFAMLACQFGARRVYAIEPNDAIVVAQANAQANGYADRIQFIQELSTRVTLPEQVDVIVSDIRGILPFFSSHFSSIFDARKRFLLPGGVQIPQSDQIWAAPVEAPEEYKRLVLGHHPNPFGVSLEAALPHTSNHRYKVRLKSEHLLAEPRCWTTLDYTTEQPRHFSATMMWTAQRSGTCHGMVVWFDATLAESITFSNAPGLPEMVYGQTFFPWLEPIALEAGDEITVALKADHVGEDYVWRWDSRINDGKNQDRVKAAFQQSDFLGIPWAPASLRKRASNFVPKLNVDGQIEQMILNLMDGDSSVEAIARQVCERYPERFKRPQDALQQVAAISSKFSQ